MGSRSGSVGIDGSEILKIDGSDVVGSEDEIEAKH
jgi:hypothetical protein